jgi:mono/diheme cytochrome c family protein
LVTGPVGPTAAPPELTAPRQAPDLAAGEVLFAERCAPCHGSAGRGDGAQASALPVPPAPLADPDLARRAVPDEWYSLVTIGRIDRFMPGFTSLNDSDRWSVVGYALTLGLRQEDVAAGKAVFDDACAGCHGEDGRGGEAGSDLTEPGLQAESSLESFFGAVSQGVEPGMPAFADTLSEEERWAAAAYVRQLGLAVAPPTLPATATQPLRTPEVSVTPLTGTVAPSGEPRLETPAAATPSLAPTGRIEGTIVNGTAGGSVPGGLEVTLHGLDGETEVVTETTTADASGSFTFNVPELVPGRLFVATVEHQGELYASEVAHLTGDEPSVSLPVTIFETTTDASAAQVDRLHLLVSIPGEGVLQVVELWILSNSGDRTIVPPEGGRGLGGTLPEGVAQLSFDEATPGERYEVAGRDFYDRRGLPPGVGTGEWVFSYVLAYDRRLDLERTTPYPIGSIVLIVPEGMSVTADGLVDTGSRDLQGESLHTYSLGPIVGGGKVSLRLSGTGRSGTTVAPAREWILGVAVLGVALIAAGWFWRRPRPRPRGAVRADSDEEDLLLSLAALDRDFEAGRVSEADYRRRRDPLKRRALEAMRRGHD